MCIYKIVLSIFLDGRVSQSYTDSRIWSLSESKELKLRCFYIEVKESTIVLYNIEEEEGNYADSKVKPAYGGL